jgi:AcrR family transcriptional regulator
MAARKLLVVTRASGGRPAKISRERIVEEARRLGPGELTFARIAERLGVRHAALYYHFQSREALLHALALELAQEFSLKPGNPKRWRPWLEETTLHFYDFLLANPAVLEVANWRGLAMFGLPILETVLETLERAGYSIEEAGRAWEVTSNLAYATARVLNDAQKAGPMTAVRNPDLAAGRPVPRARELATRINRKPRAHLAETLHWIVAAMPGPRS